jgi:hypothetical protein
VFTGQLPNNARPSVERVRFAGMCLPSRCLAMDIHVTIYILRIMNYFNCTHLRIHLVYEISVLYIYSSNQQIPEVTAVSYHLVANWTVMKSLYLSINANNSYQSITILGVFFSPMKYSCFVYLFVDCLKTLSTDRLYIKNFIRYQQSIISYFIKYKKMYVEVNVKPKIRSRE